MNNLRYENFHRRNTRKQNRDRGEGTGIFHRSKRRKRRLQICTGNEQAGDAVSELFFVEVDEEADRDVQEFHVAKELGFMDREHLFD